MVKILIGKRQIKTLITGIRPGEKIHEILVSEEEANRTIECGSYYVIKPILPELCIETEKQTTLGHEYSSADNVMTPEELAKILEKFDLFVKEDRLKKEELLR
jgi:UDP-glucose 4-epimerase